MAKAGAIRAGRAFVELGVDDKIQRGLNKAAAKLRAFGAAVTGLGLKFTAMGAAMLAPFGASLKVFANMGSEFVDMSQRTGIAIEALSELKYAAQQSGSSLEEVELGVKNMQKALLGAAKGADAPTNALRRLGLTIGDLADLSPDQQLKLIGDRLDAIEDPAIRAATAVALLGRSGTKLLPMFKGGVAGMDLLIKRAHELGLVISTEDAVAAEKFGDEMQTLWDIVKVGAFNIGRALLPALKEFVGWVTETTAAVSKWIKKNQGAITAVAAVAAGVLAAGTALLALGAGIQIAGFALGGFAAIGGIAATALTLLLKPAGVVVGLFKTLAAVVAGVLTPFGLVNAAIIGGAAYFLIYRDAGSKAIDFLKGKFGELKETATTAFGGIVDAMSAGDFALAAKILWTGLKVAWLQGTQELNDIWLDFRSGFLKVLQGTISGAQAAWAILTNWVETAWTETVSFLGRTWTIFTSSLQSAWDSTQNFLEKRWLDLMGLMDSTFDVDAAKKLADQQSQTNQQEINADRDAKLKGNETERQQQRNVQQQEFDADMARIGEEFNNIAAAIDQNAGEDMQLAVDELARLRDELAKLRQKAGEKAEERREEKGDESVEPELDVDAITTSLNDAIDRMTPSRGTFNPFEAGQLGAPTELKRIADYTKRTAESTEDIADALENAETSIPVI